VFYLVFLSLWLNVVSAIFQDDHRKFTLRAAALANGIKATVAALIPAISKSGVLASVPAAPRRAASAPKINVGT
tara:strand:- start:24 stop:245 length:222 start_codon:yes stop_codon:yes gene_type:complete